MLPPLVLPHLVSVISTLYRYLARYIVAVAKGLRDPLVYPLYTLDSLVDSLQLLKPFPNETVTYLLPLTSSFVIAQLEPSAGPIDATAKAPPLLDILNP